MSAADDALWNKAEKRLKSLEYSYFQSALDGPNSFHVWNGLRRHECVLECMKFDKTISVAVTLYFTGNKRNGGVCGLRQYVINSDGSWS